MKYIIGFMLCYFVFFGCTKKNDEVEPLGVVTISEIKSLPPITFEQLLKASDYVESNNPEVLKDSIKLSRYIFNRIKKYPNGKVNAVNEGISPFGVLNDLEFIIFFKSPIKGISILNTIKPAFKSKELFPCDSEGLKENQTPNDNKADALRHSYWNALMVKRSGNTFATEFATAHEQIEGNAPLRKAMDLHNNKIGRDLAMQFPNAKDTELLTLLSQKPYFFIEKDKTIPDKLDALVYFKDKRLFDGKFTGTLTNPDSGGPWSCIFEMNECSNVIRGEIEFKRGTATGKRRFIGTIDSNNNIKLNVANPYVFENTENLQFCASMTVSLSGSANALNGKWQASNCRLGGVIDIKR